MMQTAGQSLAKRTEALIKEYHRQSNIQQTIDALSQAFPGIVQRKYIRSTDQNLRSVLSKRVLYSEYGSSSDPKILGPFDT